MDADIRAIARWAGSQGWTITGDTKGYTRFYDPRGRYVVSYPATPSNPRRRMNDLVTKLKAAGLELPPPSKKILRSRRRRDR